MSSESTRERILDAAERLFGERGISATSLRKIIAAAEVNIAAIHYHFGSKDELVREVFGRRIRQVNLQRMENLRALQSSAAGRPIPVRELFRAFLEPAVALIGDEEHGGLTFARLVARAHSETDPRVQELLFAELSEVLRSYLREFNRSVPHMGSQECRVRMLFAAGAMVQTVLLPLRPAVSAQFLGGGLNQEQLIGSLVHFCSAGMEAPQLQEGADA